MVGVMMLVVRWDVLDEWVEIQTKAEKFCIVMYDDDDDDAVKVQSGLTAQMKSVPACITYI